MRLKENTEKSSDQIRGIASLVLALGLALMILMILLGVVTIMNGSSNSYYHRRTIIDTIIKSPGIVYIILGIVGFFWHYVAYVMISAYATFLENSDRTDVIDALYEINQSLRAKDVLPYRVEAKRPLKPMKKEQNENEDDGDIELEKIDITDIENE